MVAYKVCCRLATCPCAQYAALTLAGSFRLCRSAATPTSGKRTPSRAKTPLMYAAYTRVSGHHADTSRLRCAAVQLRSVILLNCGATLDLAAFLDNPPSTVSFYVIDR